MDIERFIPHYTNYKGSLGCQWSVQEAVFAVKFLNHTRETQRIYFKHLNFPANAKSRYHFKEQKLYVEVSKVFHLG